MDNRKWYQAIVAENGGKIPENIISMIFSRVIPVLERLVKYPGMEKITISKDSTCGYIDIEQTPEHPEYGPFKDAVTLLQIALCEGQSMTMHYDDESGETRMEFVSGLSPEGFIDTMSEQADEDGSQANN